MNFIHCVSSRPGAWQEATAIIEFFSVTHTSKNFEGARPGGACVRRRGATVPWHNGTMASPSLESWSTAAEAPTTYWRAGVL